MLAQVYFQTRISSLNRWKLQVPRTVNVRNFVGDTKKYVERKYVENMKYVGTMERHRMARALPSV